MEESSLVRLEREFDIEVDWRGVELHPETPPGGVPLEEYFLPTSFQSVWEYLKKFAASFGITDMRFPERLPNSRSILTLAEFARDKGRLKEFRHQAMNAYWREGKDLEDSGTLKAIAQQAGLPLQSISRVLQSPRYLNRVMANRLEAVAHKISGLPTLIVGQQPLFGCQTYPVLAEFLQQCGATKKAGL